MSINELCNYFLDDLKTEHIAGTMASTLVKKIQDTPAERIKAVLLDLVNEFDGFFEPLQLMVAAVRAIEYKSDEKCEESHSERHPSEKGMSDEIEFNELNTNMLESIDIDENVRPDYKEDADGSEDQEC